MAELTNTAIWWIRRDLRLADNQALQAARDYAGAVIPLFILDPALLHSRYSGEKRLAFLFAGLRDLEQGLAARGGRLIVRHGRPAAVLAALMAESGASRIFAEADISPYARRRDQAVAAELPLHLTPGLTVHPPDLIRKRDGDPYTVFTPYSKAWRALEPPQSVDRLPPPSTIVTPDSIASESIPGEPAPGNRVPFDAGASIAEQRLDRFVTGANAPVFAYAEQRNLPAAPGTSQLSPYLRFGMLSARTAVAAAYAAVGRAPDAAARKGADTWLNELIWREFYMSILFHFPHVRRRSFRPQYDAIAWNNDLSQLEAWQHGRTGYPIVDAAMRELWHTGWMHNRARMITASFLVKDLLIDWRHGEAWFMQHLVDGDPAANNGGWQWTAGVGTDAAPYFRIFNPVLQSKKFDPQGVYLRRWLPELAQVPLKYLHEPWSMPTSMQAKAACHIGTDYPAPIVDHAKARQRTLAAYKATSS